MYDYTPRKAFLNEEFVRTASEARPIRILSEYHYPHFRFAKEGITDTVVMFGSARTPSPETRNGQSHHPRQSEFAKYYDSARQLSHEITAWSQRVAEPNGRKFIVCTGGGPGIMEAANRGASEAGGLTMGLNIELPHEQKPNAYISPGLSFDFHYFFMRKFWFLFYARCLIVFPGGFGTMDELFETLTLQQTRTIRNNIPVFLFGRDFWENVVDFKLLADAGMIDYRDLDLFTVVDSVDEALRMIIAGLERAMTE